jgi:hypothetical protein
MTHESQVAEETEPLEIGVGIVEQQASSKRSQKEKLLYPILEGWLVAQGYQAADVSSGRSLGKWGNPDIAGIITLDAFNSLSIELLTTGSNGSSKLFPTEGLLIDHILHLHIQRKQYLKYHKTCAIMRNCIT